MSPWSLHPECEVTPECEPNGAQPPLRLLFNISKVSLINYLLVLKWALGVTMTGRTKHSSEISQRALTVATQLSPTFVVLIRVWFLFRKTFFFLVGVCFLALKSIIFLPVFFLNNSSLSLNLYFVFRPFFMSYHTVASGVFFLLNILWCGWLRKLEFQRH